LADAIDAFLLCFPALFSIVNPINGAFGFRVLTIGCTPADREALARKVALYSLLVMLVALWVGSFVLAFFGISVAGLRVAGGLVIAASAWHLLNGPDRQETDAPSPAGSTYQDIAVVPLTIPLTAGPGTISVAIALGSEHPAFALPFFIGMTFAAAAMAIVIWITYRSADRIARLMGPVGSRTVTRLVGFLLLCIGVQVLITGVVDVLGPLLARR
jgi:multiple antibiotic resistance protein